jgi:putative tryptophan/tyrosine transport system substrate-binding protein
MQFDRLNRRALIRLLGGAAATWPLAARAQGAAMPLIGILSGGPPASFAPYEAPLRGGLAETGFVEGKNVAFEYRWAQGQFDRLPGLAADLVGRGPAVIATNTLPAALTAKAATSAIPVVFVIGEDPVKVGLVTSLSRPGANITGMTNSMNALGAKRLELASEVVPKADGLALLVNHDNPNAGADTADLRAAADALHRRLLVLTASSEAEIEAAFAAAVQHSVGALFVNIDPFFLTRRDQFAALAVRYGVPTIYPLRDYVTAGGLMSYGANFANAWRQSGAYAGRILKGAKPADLPVLQPTKIDLVINLKTADTLGLNIPPELLALADEVIE